MKWTYHVGNMTLEFNLPDEVLENLPVDPEIGRKANPQEVKQLAEWEFFLILARNFRHAVLDEGTLQYIVDNYDNDRNRIRGNILHLLNEMQKEFPQEVVNGSAQAGNSEDEPVSLIDPN